MVLSGLGFGGYSSYRPPQYKSMDCKVLTKARDELAPKGLHRISYVSAEQIPQNTERKQRAKNSNIPQNTERKQRAKNSNIWRICTDSFEVPTNWTNCIKNSKS